MSDKAQKLFAFLDETTVYFLKKLEGVDRDVYYADRDIRNILDKTINDIILCLVDIAEECLKKNGRLVPETYRDTILACHEFLGETALKVAPLVKHRNEMIHQYLKINWQNIITVKGRIPAIQEYLLKMKEALRKQETNDSSD
jgi:uncharacterized protein YutE (UPF0331/DUF86 family)